jgi:MOSC domain-containing protein YiiM
MKLLSVNVGRPRLNPWKGLSATGIGKRPVDGPVAVTAPPPKGTGIVGLVGDRVYDVKHHGGTGGPRLRKLHPQLPDADSVVRRYRWITSSRPGQ